MQNWRMKTYPYSVPPATERCTYWHLKHSGFVNSSQPSTPRTSTGAGHWPLSCNRFRRSLAVGPCVLFRFYDLVALSFLVIYYIWCIKFKLPNVELIYFFILSICRWWRWPSKHKLYVHQMKNTQILFHCYFHGDLKPYLNLVILI